MRYCMKKKTDSDKPLFVHTIVRFAQPWRARPLFTVFCATSDPEPPANPETRAETGVGQEAADLGQTNTGCQAAPQTPQTEHRAPPQELEVLLQTSLWRARRPYKDHRKGFYGRVDATRHPNPRASLGVLAVHHSLEAPSGHAVFCGGPVQESPSMTTRSNE